MRKLYWYGAAVASTVLLCVVALHAKGSQKAASISADTDTIHALADGRRVISHGRYYRNQAGTIREDSGTGAVITDTKRGTVTFLVAETNEAHVFLIPKDRQRRKDKDPSAAAILSDGDHEGHAVKKAKVDFGDGTSQEVWTAVDTGLTVYSKSEARGVSTQKMLRNIRNDEPEPSLFSVPEGYKTTTHDLAEHPQLPAASAFPLRPQPQGRQP